MKVNNQKGFKLDKIPELSSNANVRISDAVEKYIDKIVNNYRIIALDAKKIAEESLKMSISKPLVLYNASFMIEIYLKLYLLRVKDVNEVEKFKHNIINLINEAENIDDMKKFDEFRELLRRIKDKKNRNLDYNKYQHFKYNHFFGENDVIFDYAYTEREVIKIKDLIKWIDTNFPIA